MFLAWAAAPIGMIVAVFLTFKVVLANYGSQKAVLQVGRPVRKFCASQSRPLERAILDSATPGRVVGTP
jgi:hypothetical protein